MAPAAALSGPACSSMTPSELAYLAWLQDRGFSLSGCAIGVSLAEAPSDAPHATGIRGVVATAALPAEHVLFRVPAAAVLSATSTRFAAAIADARLPSGAALAVALSLENADPQSPWRPYLDVLPEVLDTPLFWSSDERKLLAGTRVYERANREEVERVYEDMVRPFYDRISRVGAGGEHEIVLDDEARSLETFMRFGSIVLAYSFTVDKVDGSGDVAVMLPFADMLNATPTGVNSQICYGDDGSYEMMTTEPVACYAELVNSYGERANAELLTRYGYIAAVNPADGIALTLSELCAATRAVESANVSAIVRARAVLKILRKAGRFAPLPSKEVGPFAIRETVFEVTRRLRGPGGFGDVVCSPLWRVFRPQYVLYAVRQRLRQLDEADAAEMNLFETEDHSKASSRPAGRLGKRKYSKSEQEKGLENPAVKRRVTMARSVRDFSREMLARIEVIARAQRKK